MKSTGWGVIGIIVVAVAVLTLSALFPAGSGASGQPGVTRTTGLLAPPPVLEASAVVKPLGRPARVHCRRCPASPLPHP